MYLREMFVLLIIAMLLVIKFCKKALRIVLVTVISILVLYCAILYVDMSRTNTNEKPIFAINVYENESTITYQGIGYRIFEYKYTPTGITIQREMYLFNKYIAGTVKLKVPENNL